MYKQQRFGSNLKPFFNLIKYLDFRKVNGLLIRYCSYINRYRAFCPVLKYVYTKTMYMYNNNKILRRYSESFKLKILTELSHGNYSKSKLGKIYGINPSTINQWIKKYDRKDLMNTRVMVESKDEISRLKALQKEVEQLKNLLIKKDLDKLVTDTYLEVAAENLGYKNVDELKKNLNIKSL